MNVYPLNSNFKVISTVIRHSPQGHTAPDSKAYNELELKLELQNGLTILSSNVISLSILELEGDLDPNPNRYDHYRASGYLFVELDGIPNCVELKPNELYSVPKGTIDPKLVSMHEGDDPSLDYIDYDSVESYLAEALTPPDLETNYSLELLATYINYLNDTFPVVA